MKTYDLGENWNGTRTKLHVDDDQIIMQDWEDAQPLLDENQRMRNMPQARTMRGGYLAARIPATMYYEWKKDWRANHRDRWTWQTYLAMKINSRDYSKLKTSDRRL